MARHEQIRLVDDLDGPPAVETVMFRLDGQTYELDVTDGHAAELRTLFAPYAKAGSEGMAVRTGRDRGSICFN